jgi:hypothetical protein
MRQQMSVLKGQAAATATSQLACFTANIFE